MTKTFMNPNIMFTKTNTLLNLNFIYYEKNILPNGHYVIYIIIINTSNETHGLIIPHVTKINKYKPLDDT
jgi:hypothetical protein